MLLERCPPLASPRPAHSVDRHAPSVGRVRLPGLSAGLIGPILWHMKYDNDPIPEVPGIEWLRDSLEESPDVRQRRLAEQRRRNVESADYDPTDGPHGAAWTPIWRPRPGPGVSRRRN